MSPAATPAPFRYCPACGMALPGPPLSREFRCVRCGFHYFHNVASAVAALIVAADALLVTVRAHAPAAGTLDLPGGFVEPGETLEAALARELDEELALAIAAAAPRYLFSLPNRYEFAGVAYATSDSFFRIDYPATFACAGRDDVADVLWLPLAQLEPARFGLASSRTAVGRLLAGDAG